MDRLGAFALTLACEIPVVFMLARHLPARRVVPVAAGASCLTHPLAWRIAMLLTPDVYRLGVALIEAGVVVVEAIWYRCWLRLSFGRAVGISLLANAASVSVGWLLWRA